MIEALWSFPLGKPLQTCVCGARKWRREHDKAPDLFGRAPDCLMERKTRFELATPSLARTCSTAELLPRGPDSIATVFRFYNES